jgi:glycerol-3-phosphate acyltransferase PlsX
VSAGVIRVAVDALGGDRGHSEIVAGALEAASDTIRPVIFGPPGLDAGGLELVETDPEPLLMDEKPAAAVRAKPDSSLVRAVAAVGSGTADAVVSAGSTGAVLAASLLHIRRLQGIYRPGIAIVLPARRGPVVLIDAGANADARPEHLVQFGHMGSVFAQEVLGVAAPSVRLVSIGEEREKGNALTLEAHELLAAEVPGFAGNIEGTELLAGGADVVVCDGFTGNVALKTIEGTIAEVSAGLREEVLATWRGRLGGLLIRPASRRLRSRLDPDTHGGGYLLGLRGLVVVAHGSSSHWAIANAIRLAAKGVDHRIVERLRERMPERVLESSRSTTPI